MSRRPGFLGHELSHQDGVCEFICSQRRRLCLALAPVAFPGAAGLPIIQPGKPAKPFVREWFHNLVTRFGRLPMKGAIHWWRISCPLGCAGQRCSKDHHVGAARIEQGHDQQTRLFEIGLVLTWQTNLRLGEKRDCQFHRRTGRPRFSSEKAHALTHWQIKQVNAGVTKLMGRETFGHFAPINCLDRWNIQTAP